MTKQISEAPIEISKSNSINASVIWMHGLGADGHDFVPVVDILDLPTVRFILPHAPYQKITRNNGYEMRAWYDIYGLTPISREDVTGIQASQSMISQLILQEIERGIPASRIVLAGFSQGGAIALHTALRYNSALAGVLALSTYLPLKAQLSHEKSQDNQQTPILMAHGTFDEVITLDMAKASLDELQSQQYTVDWREYPMAHSVCNAEIADIKQFLSHTLSL